MKKLGIVTLAAIMVFGIVVMGTGCATAGAAAPKARASSATGGAYNYRITGNFCGWDSNYDSDWMMESVSGSDARIAPISDALKDARFVFIHEYAPSTAVPAGWKVEFSGVGISLDGNFAVKVIRLVEDLEGIEPSGWMFDMWIPSTEAGGVKNLSPDTRYTPKDRSNEERDTAKDGLGGNNDNPVLLKGEIPYYIVFAVMNDNSRAMGAVVK
jgi:hypothetical protein